MGRWWRSNGFDTRAALFKALGTLYPSGDYERVEAISIREACEEMGIPMGYGRVGLTPSQLTHGEARGQWGTGRGKRL